jgi:predicted MFS family arabinose efflux permease
MVARLAGADPLAAERGGFLFYAAVAAVVAVIYRRLSPSVERAAIAGQASLARSRRVVLRLATLFSLDAFGGGFVVQSLLVLWLYRRFQLSVATAGAIFFGAGMVGALSQFLSAKLAARIGHVRTMVYTHLPANLFLVAAGVVPNASLAVTFLLLRASLSSMDVPARQAYVMALVPPEERMAASSVTNVPRSLAAAIPPVFAGILLDRSAFGWPLVLGGALKVLYDLLLLAQFRTLRPPVER